MAPWTRHVIEAQLERVTMKNFDEIAQRIVNLLDSRANLQRLAVMIVRQANRWYTPSFHPQFDTDKRALCDSFVGRLLHALAVRHKPIKDVPTPEGLSGIPLLKADLLSVWIYRRMSIGPIATALYNSQNLTIGDVVVVVRACLEKEYTAKNRNVGDALLILEHSGRYLDEVDPKTLDAFMTTIDILLNKHKLAATEQRKVGDRIIPSFMDRYGSLKEKRRQDWQTSRSTTGNAEEAHETNPQKGKEKEPSSYLSLPCRLERDAEGSMTDEEESCPPHSPCSARAISCDSECYSHLDANSTMNDEESGPFLDLPSLYNREGERTLSRAIPSSPWSTYFAQNRGDLTTLPPLPTTNVITTSSVANRASTSAASSDQGNMARTDGGIRSKSGDENEVERTSRHKVIRESTSDQASEHDTQEKCNKDDDRIQSLCVHVEIMPRILPKVLLQSSVGQQNRKQHHRTMSENRSLEPSPSKALELALADAEVESASRVEGSVPSLHRRALSESERVSTSVTMSTFQNESRQDLEMGSDSFSKGQSDSGHESITDDSVLARLSPSLTKSNRKAYAITFQGEQTCIQLDTPPPHGLSLRLPSSVCIKDAQKMARRFTRIVDQIPDAASSSSHDYSNPIQFTATGAVVQRFSFDETRDVFVEYPAEMTLANARSIGQRLAKAVKVANL